MRKLIITVASLLALAVPTAAMATVAVDANGVGFVGKGDVQTALGLKNDAEMQDVFKSAAGAKFSVNAEKVIADYKMSCLGSDSIGHRIISLRGTVNVEALANTNNAGKLSNGWNLTGKTIGEFTPAGGATMREVACPEGSFMYLNLGQGDLWNTVSTSGGLTVTGNGKTVELPNSPVPAPVV